MKFKLHKMFIGRTFRAGELVRKQNRKPLKTILPSILLSTLIFSGCLSLMPTVDLYPDEGIDTNRHYSPLELEEDLNFLFQTFEYVHPNLYASISKDTIIADRKKIIEKLSKPLTSMEFWEIVNPIIVKLKDGHTNLSFPYDFRQEFLDNGGLIVPFEVYIENNYLYVKRNYSHDSTLAINTKILSINEIPVSEILQKMVKYRSGERLEFRYIRVENYFKPLLWVLFEFDSAYKIEYVSALNNLKYEKTFSGITLTELDSLKNQENSKKVNRPYSYYSLPDEKIGVIDFKQFSDVKRFKEFLKIAFRTIQGDSVHSLIIDIRENGGGYSNLGNILFDYITDMPFTDTSGERLEVKTSSYYRNYIKENYVKWYMYPLMPFAYFHPYGRAIFSKPDGTISKIEIKQIIPKKNALRFEGNVYLLIGPYTFSSASGFASSFKCHNMGTVVGEETGGLSVSYGNVTSVVLPNTHLRAGVSNSKYYEPCGKENGQGVIPDYEVKQTPGDREKDIDKVMEFTKDLIYNYDK